MCNRCNRCNNGCGYGNYQNEEYSDYDWNNYNNRRDPFCEVERIARNVERRRIRENRCACEFIRCMRRADCNWD